MSIKTRENKFIKKYKRDKLKRDKYKLSSDRNKRN